MNMWEFPIGGRRPVYEMILWYLRNAPTGWFKGYLRHDAAGHRSTLLFLRS